MTVVRKNKKWYASVEIEPASDGRRRRKSLGGHRTKAEAEDAVAKARVERKAGTLVATNRTTFAEWTEVWKTTRDLRPNSIEIQDRCLRRHILPVLGHTPLQKVTPSLVRQATRKPELSLTTQRMLHTVTKSILRAAVEEGLVAVNPADKVKAPSAAQAKDQAPDIFPYSADEAAEVMRRLESNRYHTLFAFLLATGCRRGEALGLTWRNVNLGAGTTLIDRTWIVLGPRGVGWGKPKNGKAREIVLGSRGIALLEAWKTRRGAEELKLGRSLSQDEQVFVHEDGRPMQPTRVSNHWAEVQRWDDIAPRRLHDLRHTFGTLALKAGMNPVDVAAQLGHDVVTLLQTYGHPTDDGQRLVVTTVSDAIWTPELRTMDGSS
jgi:integrase